MYQILFSNMDVKYVFILREETKVCTGTYAGNYLMHRPSCS